jgi:hypothetical protein
VYEISYLFSSFGRWIIKCDLKNTLKRFLVVFYGTQFWIQLKQIFMYIPLKEKFETLKYRNKQTLREVAAQILILLEQSPTTISRMNVFRDKSCFEFRPLTDRGKYHMEWIFFFLRYWFLSRLIRTVEFALTWLWSNICYFRAAFNRSCNPVPAFRQYTQVFIIR